MCRILDFFRTILKSLFSNEGFPLEDDATNKMR